MIEIALVEDQEKWQKTITSYLKKYQEEKSESFAVTIFPSGNDFLKEEKKSFDLAFMDIGLPGKSGMETSKEFRKRNQETCLVFLTELSRFAVDGYEVNAYDFLVKPLDYSFFCLKMDRILSHLKQRGQDTFVIENAGELHRVKIQEIRYIESDKHYLFFHCVSGIYKMRGILDDILKSFQNYSFAKINRSILVNLAAVEGYDKTEVEIQGEKLPLSRVYKADFLSTLNQYLGAK